MDRRIEERRRKERRAKIDSGLMLLEANNANKKRRDNRAVSDWTRRFHQAKGNLQK